MAASRRIDPCLQKGGWSRWERNVLSFRASPAVAELPVGVNHGDEEPLQLRTVSRRARLVKRFESPHFALSFLTNLKGLMLSYRSGCVCQSYGKVTGSDILGPWRQCVM